MKTILSRLLVGLAASSALQFQIHDVAAQGAGYTFLTTFTNPSPASGDNFGSAIVALDPDRVLIGARGDDTGAVDAGAAYLFATSGALLTTFTNPFPATNDYFGGSLAAVGTDRVLIGAHWGDVGATNAGVGYLYDTNGMLLTTFTNPTPASLDHFGANLAAFGSDRVLIGASLDNMGAADAGVAYLFHTDGTLLTVFTNPTPAASDEFGSSVAARGTDQVLVGSVYDDLRAANAGAVYLFNTNGAVLGAFTNPLPTSLDYFGQTVTMWDSNRVLIAASGEDRGANQAGVAYLFSSDGVLLTTFTNPAPAINDWFGSSLAAVGNDRVLIGAFLDDLGATNAGAAYLFSTNGMLLTTFTNPAVTVDGRFGDVVEALGEERVLIGAPRNHTATTDAGVAYLFSLQPLGAEIPRLTVGVTNANLVIVSWPSSWIGWTLQENTNGVASVNWSTAPGPIQDDGVTRTLIVNPPTGNRFYRLLKP